MTQDGITTTQDAHGNASITDDKGTTWTANSNGTGKIFDKQGNSIDLHKDGSITVKTADGKTTNYTQDELKQMQAQPDTGAPGAATGGN
jgi:polyribonucleotide nucleotidyltransferase